MKKFFVRDRDWDEESDGWVLREADDVEGAARAQATADDLESEATYEVCSTDDGGSVVTIKVTPKRAFDCAAIDEDDKDE